MSITTPQRSWSRVVAVGLLSLAMALLVPATATSAEVVDRIVAQVNDRIITLYELEQAAVPYLLQQGQDPALLHTSDRRDELLEEVLQSQVDQILLEMEAEEMGVSVEEGQIQQWMEMTAQQQNMTVAQFRQLLSREGIDFESYRSMVADQILRMQLMQARGGGGGVSQSDVDAEYRRRHGRPEEGSDVRVTARHILLVPDGTQEDLDEVTQRLEEMRQQILDGEATFEELADAYSQGPGAGDGGLIGTFGRGELAPSFEDEVFDLPEGQVSSPVVTDFGVHLIEVLERESAPSQQVQQRREQIEMELQERRMERRLESMVDSLRERAYVDIRL